MKKDYGPWKTLALIGHINLVLGILSFVRVGMEILEGFHISELRIIPASYWAMLALELPIAAMSVLSGVALRARRDWALAATSVAGGMILAATLIAWFLIGPAIVQELRLGIGPWSQELHERMAFGSRLLLYGIRILYWPFALRLILRDQRPCGLPDAYAIYSRRLIGWCFVVSLGVSALGMLVLEMAFFRSN